MIYVKSVIELMQAFPGREWRMRHLIKYARPGKLSRSERQAAHMQVWRIMRELEETGSVQINKAGKNGEGAGYVWKP